MFLTNQPAMAVKDYLVIADVHIGITKALKDAGVLLPSQVEKLARQINALKRTAKAKKLIVLGDFKHEIPRISWQERVEIPQLLELLDFKSIVITKGNHDGNIEKIVHDKRVKIKKSFTVGNYIFSHGHRRIKTKKKTIVIGHNHPHVRFIDDIGTVYTQPCWVIGRASDARVIMVPAFNELCGATVVNGKDDFLGPIARHIDRKNARIYLLDSTYLGRVRDLITRK
jgi:putative SbcD/Mre11-related phosphoesterase